MEDPRDNKKLQDWGSLTFFGVLETSRRRAVKYYFSKKLLYYKCQSKYSIAVQNILLQKYIIHHQEAQRRATPGNCWVLCVC